MKLSEFDFIEKIKSGEKRLPKGFYGIGDDCAILPQDDGYSTLVSTDMLIEGTHFLLDKISANSLGWKAAAVNLSDIAAMGGTPTGIFLSIAISDKIDDDWMELFILGFREICNTFHCPILGGDTVKSQSVLCINVTVTGTCRTGMYKKRSYAKPGDEICVLGTLGDSAAGLKILMEQAINKRGKLILPDFVSDDKELISELNMYRNVLIHKHWQPFPQVKEASRLANFGSVHAMMDISDGLGSDLRHILKASKVGAEIDCSAIPISDSLRAVCDYYGWDPLEFALNGGEDYKLLFTREAGANVDYYPTVIGHITEGSELKWLGSDKDYCGYRHF